MPVLPFPSMALWRSSVVLYRRSTWKFQTSSWLLVLCNDLHFGVVDASSWKRRVWLWYLCHYYDNSNCFCQVVYPYCASKEGIEYYVTHVCECVRAWAGTNTHTHTHTRARARARACATLVLKRSHFFRKAFGELAFWRTQNFGARLGCSGNTLITQVLINWALFLL